MVKRVVTGIFVFIPDKDGDFHCRRLLVVLINDVVPFCSGMQR